MKYKALRPCSFAGVSYLIGDIIPDGVVLNQASTRLIKSGVIEAVVGEGVTPPLPTTLAEPEEEAPEEPMEEVAEAEEAESEEIEAEAESVEAQEFTVDNLMRLKKEELLELAEANGLDMKALKGMKKPEIAEAVFEVVKDEL